MMMSGERKLEMPGSILGRGMSPVVCLFSVVTATARIVFTYALWYVYRRAIFDAGMGRDNGYYCDVLSSGVICFLLENNLVWLLVFIPSTGHLSSEIGQCDWDVGLDWIGLSYLMSV